MGTQKLTNRKSSVLYAVVMWILGILCIYPFIMMVLISFRNQGDVYLPLFGKARITIANYLQVLKTQYFLRWYWNTFRTVAVSIFFRLIVTILASYAFALAHLPSGNITRLLTFFPGLLFGAIRYRTGGLIGAIVCHACCNLMMVVLNVHYF